MENPSVAPATLTYPADPLAGLTARVQAPPSMRIGQVLVYMVTMSNPTSTRAVLSPCPGYHQLLDSTKSASSFYHLNCGAAHAIRAGGSESFEMQLRVYSAAPGRHSLCWTLDAASSSSPSACATINFNTQHRNKPALDQTPSDLPDR